MPGPHAQDRAEAPDPAGVLLCERRCGDYYATALTSRAEVERTAVDADDAQRDPRAVRPTRVTAGQEGVDLLLGERSEGDTVADINSELVGQRLANGHLVHCRWVRRAPGHHASPVDHPTESVVERTRDVQVLDGTVEQRELSERRDRADALLTTKRAELLGGRVTG